MEELKEQLLKGTFYYHKSNLFIKSEITRVVVMEDIFLEISFQGGNVEVFIDNVKSVKRPANIVASFEWCYVFKNEDNECIGYIGLKEEQKQ